MKTGIELIAIERQEQIEKHGRTIESDVHLNSVNQQLIGAASLLTLNRYNGSRFTNTDIDALVPFNWDINIWRKMMYKPYKERLIIAGALIAAEIDRIQTK